MLSSILTPCGLFCVNSDRSSPWNSCQLFSFLFYYFFSVLPMPSNSGIVGFYRIHAGRYMVEESPFIARSISRIPLLPGMCQVGIRHCWGMGKTDFRRLPSHFFLPFSLRNKQRRRRRLSYKSFSMLLLTWVHSTVVPRETEDNAYAKSRGSNNAFYGDLI